MKTRHLAYVVALNGIATCLFLGWAAKLFLTSGDAGVDRPLLPWSPSADLLRTESTPEPRPYTLHEATARPLFRASRRPFDPNTTVQHDNEQAPPPELADVSSAEPPPYDPNAFVLLGVWQVGANAKALIGTAEAPEGQWLEAGSVVAGWTVVSLDSSGVTLKWGDTQFRLQLYVDNPTNGIGGLTQRF